MPGAAAGSGNGMPDVLPEQIAAWEEQQQADPKGLPEDAVCAPRISACLAVKREEVAEERPHPRAAVPHGSAAAPQQQQRCDKAAGTKRCENPACGALRPGPTDSYEWRHHPPLRGMRLCWRCRTYADKHGGALPPPVEPKAEEKWGTGEVERGGAGEAEREVRREQQVVQPRQQAQQLQQHCQASPAALLPTAAATAAVATTPATPASGARGNVGEQQPQVAQQLQAAPAEGATSSGGDAPPRAAPPHTEAGHAPPAAAAAVPAGVGSNAVAAPGPPGQFRQQREQPHGGDGAPGASQLEPQLGQGVPADAAATAEGGSDAGEVRGCRLCVCTYMRLHPCWQLPSPHMPWQEVARAARCRPTSTQIN